MGSGLLLGLGGTVDYEIVWDAAALQGLADAHGVRAAELDPAAPIGDERGIVVSILSFLREGRGGERFVASPAVLERFAARFRFVSTLGGTCVRAALAMAELGIASTVHLVSIDDTVRRLLPGTVSWVCSASADSTDPHVIIQYPAGAVIRLVDAELVAPHPNRLIYVNDRPNRELVLSPRLEDLAAESRLFLISGFNTIQDPEILEDRLARVVAASAAMQQDALAIFEDAGSHDPALGVRVRDVMARTVDVYGMNEDELFGYHGGLVDLLDAAEVEAALRRTAELIPVPVLVVHTKHWALALAHDSSRWRDALEGAVTAAATRYRVGDALSMAEWEATRLVPRQARAVEFAHELEERLGARVAVVPAFALDTAAPTTIGLGDTFVGGFIAALARDEERGMLIPSLPEGGGATRVAPRPDPSPDGS